MFNQIFPVDVDGSKFKASPQEFLSMNMKRKVIKNIVLTSLGDEYKFSSYKVARFLLSIDPG